MTGNAADQRLLELIDRWLASLDLHVTYARLDDASYRRVQDWVEHERPSKWIIDLARQKTLALRALLLRRIEAGDAEFSDALEMTIFLANLVGLQHIERFIPMANAANEDATRELPHPKQTGATTATREMPRFEPAPAKSSPDAARVARGERNAGARSPPPPPPPPKAAAKSAAKGPVKPALSPSSSALRPISPAAREQVIADAVRLLQWGRKWYELAEAISRLADRPAVTDVRRILKDNKAIIDQQMPAR